MREEGPNLVALEGVNIQDIDANLATTLVHFRFKGIQELSSSAIGQLLGDMSFDLVSL